MGQVEKTTGTPRLPILVARLPGTGFRIGLGIALLLMLSAGYHLLETGEVDAVVFDAPVLQHYASQRGKGRVRVVGLVFQEKNYGIALSEKSELRDRINIALLKLVENGTFDTMRKKWFGT